jgi:hypothetical protein
MNDRITFMRLQRDSQCEAYRKRLSEKEIAYYDELDELSKVAVSNEMLCDDYYADCAKIIQKYWQNDKPARTVQESLTLVRQDIQKIQEVLDSDLSDNAKLLYYRLAMPNSIPSDGLYNFSMLNLTEWQKKAVVAMEELIESGYVQGTSRKGKIFGISSIIPDAPPKQYIYVLQFGRCKQLLFEPLFFPYDTKTENSPAVAAKYTPEEVQYIREHPEILYSKTKRNQPSLFSHLE